MFSSGRCSSGCAADRAQAAVDHEFGGRHEAALGGREIHGRVRDVVRLAEPAQRNAARELARRVAFAERLEQRLDDPRADECRVNRIAAHVDLAARAVDRDRLRPRRDRGLRRVVRSEIRLDLERGDRRDVDDRRGMAFGQIRQRVLAAEHDALDVDRHHAPPFVQLDLRGRADRADARVVDEHRQPAHRVDRLREQRLPACFVAHVLRRGERDRRRVARVEFLRECVEHRGFRDVGHEHARALLDHPARDRAAEAARGARDVCALAGKARRNDCHVTCSCRESSSRNAAATGGPCLSRPTRAG